MTDGRHRRWKNGVESQRFDQLKRAPSDVLPFWPTQGLWKTKSKQGSGIKNEGEENLQETKGKTRNKELQKPRSEVDALEGEPDIFEYSEHTFEETNSNRIKWRQCTKGREIVIMTKKRVYVLTRIGRRINRRIFDFPGSKPNTPTN